MSASKKVTIGLVAGLAVLLSSGMAWAGPHDLQLSQFGRFQASQNTPVPCNGVCGGVVQDDEAFALFARELGEVFAPRLIAPSETLGQAGFAVLMMTTFSTIPNHESHWQTGMEGSPASVLFTSHLQVRKGLPFSFEVAGNLAHLYGSEMFTMGADLRWALNEGFAYFPDVAARGSVNTVVGAPELNMVNAAWDLSMSKSFGIGGVMSLTPYLGYQQLYTIASSRVLNAYPQDPRPPRSQERSIPDSNATWTETFAPEFVFSQEVSQVNRFFLGSRANVWILSFTLEAVFGEAVNQFTFAGGFDF